MASISDTKKKRIGRPTTGIGPNVGLRLHADLQTRVDAWAERQDEKISRPEAIRRLVELGLKAKK